MVLSTLRRVERGSVASASIWESQGVAHHIVGVIVDVLVRGAVDVKDVGASLAGGVEQGFF